MYRSRQNQEKGEVQNGRGFTMVAEPRVWLGLITSSPVCRARELVTHPNGSADALRSIKQSLHVLSDNPTTPP